MSPDDKALLDSWLAELEYDLVSLFNAVSSNENFTFLPSGYIEFILPSF